MAGVGETSAIFGLVTSSIDVVKVAIEICKAADGTTPKRIAKVASRLPSFLSLLENASTSKDKNDPVWRNVKSEVETCEAACKALKAIFDQACPPDGASRRQRMWITSKATLRGLAGDAEELEEEIYKSLEVLEGQVIITNSTLLQELKTSIDGSENGSDGIHYAGSGNQLVNRGDGTFNYQTGAGSNIIERVGTYNAAAATNPGV
jgi:hypothetical protein